MRNTAWQKQVLIVHPDLRILSSYQSLLSGNNFSVVVARYIPTTLLAITQHHCDLAIISSSIAEAGDGWTVAAVIKMAFPRSFIAVLAPGQDVLTLQTAINHGVQEIYDSEDSPDEVVKAILSSSTRNQAAADQTGVSHLQ